MWLLRIARLLRVEECENEKIFRCASGYRSAAVPVGVRIGIIQHRYDCGKQLRWKRFRIFRERDGWLRRQWFRQRWRNTHSTYSTYYPGQW